MIIYHHSIQKPKWLHLSIDDTILLFADLDMHKDSYHSIFDNSTLNYARELHNLYGAKISFYCFYEFSDIRLNEITSQYLHEFEENSDWLKFGFHAYDGIKDYNVSDITQDYESVVQELERIVGKRSITNQLRLEKFYLSTHNAEKLSEYGVNVLFGSDSLNQNSYYLSKKQSKQLFLKETYYDFKTKIKFYKTDIRLENVEDIEATIEAMQNDSNIILFTHEWLLDDAIKENTKKLLLQLIQLGYQF